METTFILQAKGGIPRPFPTAMAILIFYSLQQAFHGWETLARFVNDLLGIRDEIFDLEAHDDLIFDNDLYTRSRKYFWVINCLNESEKILAQNIQTWANFRRDTLLRFGQKLLKEGNVEMNKELSNEIRKCDETQAKLEKINEQFNEQRTKAVALRDGASHCDLAMRVL